MARHVGKTTLAARVNIPFCIAVVLLCLTLVSMHLTSGLFARYSTSVTDDDSARVAKFEVTSAVSEFADDFVPPSAPGTSEYRLKITNSSEVAVSCSVNIVNKTGNIPLKFSVVEERGEAGAERYYNDDGLEIGSERLYTTASAAHTFTLPANDGEKTYLIETAWNVDGKEALDYMGRVDLVKLTVNVEQID